jgi:hypothetical protein
MLIASFVAAAALAVMAPLSRSSVIEVSDVEQLYDASMHRPMPAPPSCWRLADTS